MTQLHREHGADINTRIVQEMGIWSGSVRVDIAVINGKLSGFELKSDRDTLERLPVQVYLYSKVFDEMVLVVGEKHADKALQAIPDWWGVTVAAQAATSVCLSEIRAALPNPALDPRILAKLLWKEEALKVLESLGRVKGWRSKAVSAIHDHLAATLSLRDLSHAVRSALKARDQWLGKLVCDHREMAIDADLHPRLPTA